MPGFTNITENPEYQKAIRKLMQTPPAVRALVNSGDVTSAFAKDTVAKDLQLKQFGESRTENQRKLTLAEQGIGTAQSYYNLKVNAAEDALELQDRADLINNSIGLARVGLAGYGAWENNKLKNKLKTGSVSL